MKCPYCGNEMEQGYITARGAYWIKKGREVPFFPRKSKGDIPLVAGWSLCSGDNSYVCRKCNKIMIDLNEPPAI